MSDPLGQDAAQRDPASAEGSADRPAFPDETASGSLFTDTASAVDQDAEPKTPNGASAQDRAHRAFAYIAEASAPGPPLRPNLSPTLGPARSIHSIRCPRRKSSAALRSRRRVRRKRPPLPSGGSDALFPAIVSATDPVSDNADEAVQGDAARSTYGVTGAGIKIGIISDSFNLHGGAATDEADGALPAASSVHILKDGSSGSDEGRAMAQIVHSIAPGAQIYFYTVGSTDAAMAQAIAALQQAGCQIIVDDVSFLDEPFYEEGGTISQAVNQAVADGTTYFTAANNFAQSYYEGVFNPISTGGVKAEDFNVAGAPHAWLEPISIPLGATVIVDLQWAQPFLTSDGAANGTGSANSLAYKLLNSSQVTVNSGTANDIGSDPLQVGEYRNNTSSTTFYLEVYQNVAGGPTPGQFKIIVEDDSFTPVAFNDPNASTGSGTVLGHEADPNAITVGAVPESNPATLEPYTASGPGEFLYDANGNLLAAPVSGGKVNLLAPDGNSTSVFNPFYGTSAAAPAAAAVGALTLQANGALDPSDIDNILGDSATPVAGSVTRTGAGLVDADLAVAEAETLTFSETASNGTLLGTHLNDTFVGGPGSHTINGEGGIDTLDYSAAPASVTVNFATGTALNGYGGTDSFTNIEIAKGSAFADAFVSASAGETLYGGGGLDSVDFSALVRRRAAGARRRQLRRRPGQLERQQCRHHRCRKRQLARDFRHARQCRQPDREQRRSRCHGRARRARLGARREWRRVRAWRDRCGGRGLRRHGKHAEARRAHGFWRRDIRARPRRHPRSRQHASGRRHGLGIDAQHHRERRHAAHLHGLGRARRQSLRRHRRRLDRKRPHPRERRRQHCARAADAHHAIAAGARQCAGGRHAQPGAQHHQQRRAAGRSARRIARAHDRRRDSVGHDLAACRRCFRCERHRGRARHRVGRRAVGHGRA